MAPETPAYRLVRATTSDQPWLEALRRSVYQELFVLTFGGWDEARHARHCAECWASGHISLIEIDGERIGMIQLYERQHEIEIGEIQLQPSHQNRGIGSRLLRDIIARAHLDGRNVVLSVGLKNDRARRLYRRLGFHDVARSETHHHMEAPVPRPTGHGSLGDRG